MRWFSAIFTFIAGSFITVQSGQNSELKAIQPLPALIANYVAGMSAALLALAFQRKQLSALSNAGDAPWWSWFGGISGALWCISGLLRNPAWRCDTDFTRC